MLKMRLMKLAIPVAVGALALTACGSDDDGDGGGGDDSAGGGGTSFTIAYQGPLSGDNVDLGINMENGVKLAVDHANASGDYDVEFTYLGVDDQGLGEKATAAAQKAIDDTSVIGVVGPAFSGAAGVAAPTYGQAGMVALSPSATNPELTQKGFPTFLRGVPHDGEQGAAIATYLVSQGVTKVTVIDGADDYSVGLADVAQEGLADAGVEVDRQSLPANTVDHSGIARKVVDAGSDGVVYTGYYSQAGPLAVKLDEAGFSGVKLAGDGTKDPSFVELAQGAGEGWFLSCPCGPLEETEAGQKFLDDFKAEFNVDAGTYSVESYDAAMMIIEAAGELGADATRESVYEKVSTSTHQGVAKELKFDESGEFAGQGVYIYQVEGGEIVSLGNVVELTS